MDCKERTDEQQWVCAICEQQANKYYLCRVCGTYVCRACLDSRRHTVMCIACGDDENLLETLDELLAEFVNDPTDL